MSIPIAGWQMVRWAVCAIAPDREKYLMHITDRAIWFVHQHPIVITSTLSIRPPPVRVSIGLAQSASIFGGQLIVRLEQGVARMNDDVNMTFKIATLTLRRERARIESWMREVGFVIDRETMGAVEELCLRAFKE